MNDEEERKVSNVIMVLHKEIDALKETLENNKFVKELFYISLTVNFILTYLLVV